MNRYASLTKSNNSRMAAAAVLALCVLLSGTILFSRLMHFSPQDTCHYIPLTRSSGFTTVTRMQPDENGSLRQAGLRIGQPRFLVASPGFQVDDGTIWMGETDVEIFRIFYNNESGETTVTSRDGDKLLAPGTGGTYTFALKNTGNVALEYSMSMEAYLSHGEYTIPVRARVTDPEGNFLAGTAEEMADVLELNQVSAHGDLRAGYVMPYTLEWEWPFEEDDAYDTMLGNLAVDADIALTIVINTMASYTPAPGGGYPQTGDTTDLAMLTAMVLISGTGLVTMLYIPGRKREGSHE